MSIISEIISLIFDSRCLTGWLDVNLVLGQLSSQTNVLTTLADCQRQLIVRYVDRAAMMNLDDLVAFVINAARILFFTVVVVKVQAVNRSWLQGILDEDRWVRAVFDDIDVFAAQLVDDCLNPGASWTNTGTNRIDVRVF